MGASQLQVRRNQDAEWTALKYKAQDAAAYENRLFFIADNVLYVYDADSAALLTIGALDADFSGSLVVAGDELCLLSGKNVCRASLLNANTEVLGKTTAA